MINRNGSDTGKSKRSKSDRISSFDKGRWRLIEGREGEYITVKFATREVANTAWSAMASRRWISDKTEVEEEKRGNKTQFSIKITDAAAIKSALVMLGNKKISADLINKVEAISFKQGYWNAAHIGCSEDNVVCTGRFDTKAKAKDVANLLLDCGMEAYVDEMEADGAETEYVIRISTPEGDILEKELRKMNALRSQSMGKSPSI